MVERRKEEIKNIFSETLEIKHEFAMLNEQRRNSLLQIPEYEKAVKKGKDANEVKKGIVIKFDREHSSLIKKIDDKKVELKSKEQSLALLSISMIAEGKNPEIELLVKGKKRVLKPSWKVSFKQPRLL